MKIDVSKIDRHLKFCHAQLSRLEELDARAPGPGWPANAIREFKSIVETLTDVQRAQQMTTMSGKPIE